MGLGTAVHASLRGTASTPHPGLLGLYRSPTAFARTSRRLHDSARGCDGERDWLSPFLFLFHPSFSFFLSFRISLCHCLLPRSLRRVQSSVPSVITAGRSLMQTCSKARNACGASHRVCTRRGRRTSTRLPSHARPSEGPVGQTVRPPKQGMFYSTLRGTDVALSRNSCPADIPSAAGLGSEAHRWALFLWVPRTVHRVRIAGTQPLNVLLPAATTPSGIRRIVPRLLYGVCSCRDRGQPFRFFWRRLASQRHQPVARAPRQCRMRTAYVVSRRRQRRLVPHTIVADCFCGPGVG